MLGIFALSAENGGKLRHFEPKPNRRRRSWPPAAVLIETLPDALTVPATAVQQGPQDPYVYVIKPDDMVEQRVVAVRQVGARRAVVTAGLQPGEQVVVNGQSRLQPGSHVTLREGAAGQQPATEEKQQTVIP